MMGPASELGPIDPQLTIREEGKLKRFSVWNLLQSYKAMFGSAIKETGNLQPYLQQLANYDYREMEECKAAMELSDDIAIRSLASGMMPGKLTAAHKAHVRKKIGVFLTPKQTKAHGRPIYHQEAKDCGIAAELQDVKTAMWGRCYELYVRLITLSLIVPQNAWKTGSIHFTHQSKRHPMNTNKKNKKKSVAMPLRKQMRQYEKMAKEIAPFVKRRQVEEYSTVGRWGDTSNLIDCDLAKKRD